jgi:hypothetical protein
VPITVLKTIQVLIAGPPEHVAAELNRYIDAGVRHIVCRIAAPTLDSQLGQLEPLATILSSLNQ